MKYIVSKQTEAGFKKINKTEYHYETLEAAINYCHRYAVRSKGFLRCDVYDVRNGGKAYSKESLVFSIEKVQGELVETSKANDDVQNTESEKVVVKQNLPWWKKPEFIEMSDDDVNEDTEFVENVIYVGDKKHRITFDCEVAVSNSNTAFNYVWDAVGKYLKKNHLNYALQTWHSWDGFGTDDLPGYTLAGIVMNQHYYKDLEDFYNDYGFRVDIEPFDDGEKVYAVYVCISFAKDDVSVTYDRETKEFVTTKAGVEISRSKNLNDEPNEEAEEVKADRVAESDLFAEIEADDKKDAELAEKQAVKKQEDSHLMLIKAEAGAHRGRIDVEHIKGLIWVTHFTYDDGSFSSDIYIPCEAKREAEWFYHEIAKWSWNYYTVHCEMYMFEHVDDCWDFEDFKKVVDPEYPAQTDVLGVCMALEGKSYNVSAARETNAYEAIKATEITQAVKYRGRPTPYTVNVYCNGLGTLYIPFNDKDKAERFTDAVNNYPWRLWFKVSAELIEDDNNPWHVAESVTDYTTSMMEVKETMASLGPAFLSDAELLGFITKTNPNSFHNNDIGTIIRNPLICEGVGKAKTATIEAVKELLKRLVKGNDEKVIVHGPDDIARVLMPEYRYKQKEYFLAVLMNTKNHIIKVAEISMGSLSASIVHPREVFHEAIKYHAARLIVAHNHPSGDPSPSREDVQVTNRLVKSGKILDIPVLDHIIIGDGRYLSFKERGIMP